MEKYTILDIISFILAIIGGLNWGLVGINEQWNIVHALLQNYSAAERIVYIIIGLASLWAIYAFVHTSLAIEEKEVM